MRNLISRASFFLTSPPFKKHNSCAPKCCQQIRKSALQRSFETLVRGKFVNVYSSKVTSWERRKTNQIAEWCLKRGFLRLRRKERQKISFSVFARFSNNTKRRKILHNREQSKYHQSWGYTASHRQGREHIQQQKITNSTQAEMKEENEREEWSAHKKSFKSMRKNYSFELCRMLWLCIAPCFPFFFSIVFVEYFRQFPRFSSQE